MIVEERTYRIVAGRLPEYLEVYERKGLSVQRDVLGQLLGYFTTEVGGLSSLVHLWGYDSFDERSRRRALLQTEQRWQNYLRECTPMIQKMQNRILVPTSFSPIS